jgi:hypothetical protein
MDLFSADEERVLIGRILKAQGTLNEVHSAFAEKISKTKAENSWLPKATLDSLHAMVTDERIVETVGESWRGRFTLAQLREIVKFLESSSGKAYGRQLNSIMMEQSVMSGALGMELYATLSRLHPDKFPRSAQEEARVRAQLESLKKGRKK